MQAIYKYPLGVGRGPQTFRVPTGGIIRHVGTEGQDDVCLWIETDPNAQKVERTFRVYLTGMAIEPGMTYVGTAISHTDLFVWHVYEEQ